MKDIYYVERTACYPAEWKVRSNKDTDNATCNYFRERIDAEAEAARRNEVTE